jgi:hypothetical protein
VRKIAARLLSCLKPIDGWKSKAEAAEAIVDDLIILIQKYETRKNIDVGIIKERHSAIPLIERWMRKYEFVFKAFKENASQDALKILNEPKFNKP